MERPSFAVDEVGGLALTYGNAQSEGSAFPRMLAVAGAALDIDMDRPHTDQAYTDEDDHGATPQGNAGARHPNRAGNEKRDRDQALRRPLLSFQGSPSRHHSFSYGDPAGIQQGTDGGSATLTMARAAAAGRHRRQVHVRSVAAAVLALALLLCHWPGLALGFFPPRDSNPAAGVDDQIVGGRYANPKRYPYMASLRDPNTRHHFCAGALIEATVILTAAHCLDDRAKPGAAVYEPLVFMGWECDETCSDEERRLSRPETSGTALTILHHVWRGTTIEGGDLALLILKRPMTKPLLNVRWQPELFLYRLLTFLGWGLDGSGNPVDKLKIAQLPYRPNENCQDMYMEMQGMREDFLLDDMMCAGGFGDNTCKGDSGGPLIVAGETYQEDIGPDRQCCSLHPGTCNRAYSSPNTGTHSSPHPGTYTGTHSRPHPSAYTGTHPSAYTGTHCSPHPGTYTGTHSSPHPSAYTGTHSSPHPGTYTGTHPGAYSSPYSRPIPTCWAVPEPNGGVSLSLSDDSHQEVPFSAGFAFPFFGKHYESVFVGSNGYLTFGEGENEHSASASTHSRLLRISGLLTDLVPDAESSIKYLQTADTFAVIYHNMLHYGSNNERSSFWITLGRSGQVTLSYGEVAGSSTAVIGLSSGSASSSEASLLGADDVCPPDVRRIQTPVLRDLAQSNPSKLASWLQEGHTACDFEGVDCDSTGVVIKVDLRGKSLTGPLPPSWSALTGLTHLNLGSNQLTGPLPPSWSALTGLTQLWLTFNQLTGPLPPSWSALTGLTQLYFNANQLTGPLPPSWSALTGLTSLYLYANQLTGPLPPSWSALTGLTGLSLSTNQLTGPLPPSWSALTGLTGLRLHINQLTGPLPPSWSALTGLTQLRLEENELTGSVPPSWSALSKLISGFYNFGV
eukprot:jgi/Tetstr1/435149/TSEL_002609.t4